MHKKGTLGWIREQKQKKELNKAESVKEVEKEVEKELSKIELPKIEYRVERKVQCLICDKYFVTDLEMDDDICNECWPLVNNK